MSGWVGSGAPPSEWGDCLACGRYAPLSDALLCRACERDLQNGDWDDVLEGDDGPDL